MRNNSKVMRADNQREQKLRMIASISQQDPNPVIRLDLTGGVIYANAEGHRLLNFWKKNHQDFPDKIKNAIKKTRKTAEVVQVEINASEINYLFTLVWISDSEQVNLYGTNITQLKSTEQKMTNLAHYDGLTNLPNRHYFEETLKKLLKQAKQAQEKLALLMIDLDNFKSFNDDLGHHIGDKLLQAVASRMSTALREEDFIARLGGDEFIILIVPKNEQTIETVASKIIDIIASPFQIEDYSLTLTGSIGISVLPDDGIKEHQLLRNADLAMYEAKKEGGNQYALFSGEVGSQNRFFIKNAFKSAITKNQFYIDYQPQFDLDSQTIIGFEAYIRWNHPKRGLILPNEFIQLAEQTGYIRAIGNWVIEKALHDYAMVMAPLKAKLSLNISLKQLGYVGFLDYFYEKLNKFNLKNNQIIFDVSDKVITAQYEQLYESLETIHQLGIQLSLDNFGHSASLIRLLDIPVDFLKINHDFLHNAEKNPSYQQLISGIIELAGKLKLRVIQKGVEKEEQNDLIKTLGCQYAQGFYYCYPMSLKNLEIFLANYSNVKQK